MDLQIKNTYSKAYVEILEIINYMGQDYKKKIPNKLLNFFEENKAVDYEYKLKNLNMSTPFLNETLIILALIEQKYWTSDKEREALKQSLKENEEKYQENLRKKYNSNELFKSEFSKEKIKENEGTSNSIKLYKESIFTKIKNYFKKIFGRNM